MTHPAPSGQYSGTTHQPRATRAPAGRHFLAAIKTKFAGMPNTYSKLNIHAVFAVKHRIGLLLPEWRNELFQCIAGILKAETNYSLAVGGWRDHVHIFFEQKPAQSTADVLRVVKTNSSKWINERGFFL